MPDRRSPAEVDLHGSPVREARQRIAVGQHQRLATLALQELGHDGQPRAHRHDNHDDPEQEPPVDGDPHAELGDQLDPQ